MSAVAPSAIAVPSSTPATVSENQCALRYTRDRAMTNAAAAASTSHFRRSGPACMNARTSATTIEAVATACPDGNDGPVVGTSDAGGRNRAKPGLAPGRAGSPADQPPTPPPKGAPPP